MTYGLIQNESRHYMPVKSHHKNDHAVTLRKHSAHSTEQNNQVVPTDTALKNLTYYQKIVNWDGFNITYSHRSIIHIVKIERVCNSHVLSSLQFSAGEAF